jgi:NAD+ kinase
VVRSDGSSGEELWALNDVVLHKRGVARVVGLELEVEENGETEAIGSFTGDGVIVATPTGSTAYSLSAGGPVIAPTTGCIIITPISPHTMAMRPLVLPDHVRLSIRAVDRAEDLVLTADGQVAVDLGPGDSVQVRKGAHRIDLVRLPGQTFFDTLRHKLNWAV